MKYLISAVVLLLGFLWWKKQRAAAKPDDAALKAAQREELSKRSGSQPVAMVACAHCGMHVPEQDTVRKSGAAFCSQAHADAHGRS